MPREYSDFEPDLGNIPPFNEVENYNQIERQEERKEWVRMAVIAVLHGRTINTVPELYKLWDEIESEDIKIRQREKTVI